MTLDELAWCLDNFRYLYRHGQAYGFNLADVRPSGPGDWAITFVHATGLGTITMQRMKGDRRATALDEMEANFLRFKPGISDNQVIE